MNSPERKRLDVVNVAPGGGKSRNEADLMRLLIDGGPNSVLLSVVSHKSCIGKR